MNKITALGPWLQLVLAALFTCSHTRIRATEGKTYCPDCGQGVVFRWVILKCMGCGHRRNSHYQLRKVVPHEKCCIACGEAETQALVLQDPEFYQLRHALLQWEIDAPESIYQVSATLSDRVKANLLQSVHAVVSTPQLPVPLAS